MPRLSDILGGFLGTGQPKRRTPRHGARAPAPTSTRAKKPPPDRSPPPSPEREALIQEAMRIHRAKQALLSKLPDEERFVLKVMANEMMQSSGRRPQAGKATADDRRKADQRSPSTPNARKRPVDETR